MHDTGSWFHCLPKYSEETIQADRRPRAGHTNFEGPVIQAPTVQITACARRCAERGRNRSSWSLLVGSVKQLVVGLPLCSLLSFISELAFLAERLLRLNKSTYPACPCCPTTLTKSPTCKHLKPQASLAMPADSLRGGYFCWNPRASMRFCPCKLFAEQQTTHSTQRIFYEYLRLFWILWMFSTCSGACLGGWRLLS